MYRKISLVDAEKVYIKTFGGFDLYYRGKEIDFSNAKAKELLAEHRDWTIAQVAAACGFQDYNYFISAFKKNTGYSPKQYQKNIP